MADSKITALTAISTVDPTADPLVIVDVSDTSMAASGTTKKSTINQLLGAGGTATLASATITGDLTVDTSTLKVDSANDRVGVGTAIPGAKLTVAGASEALRLCNAAPYLTFYNAAQSSRFGYIQHNGTNLGIVNEIAGSLELYTNNTLQATLNSTGLGVGTSPSFKLDVQGSGIRLNSGSATGFALLRLGGTASDSFFGFAGNANDIVTGTSAGDTVIGSNKAGANLRFISGNGVINATLDASGNFLVGQTASTNGNLLTGYAFNYNSGASQFFIGHQTGTASGTTYEGFSYNGTLIGSITQSGTTGVSFNATSDYRLKEAVQPITGALNRIAALKPSIYKWKADGSSGEGFLAHELAEAVPLAVTGEKDAVNEDGSIKPQQVDLSKVVPVLVAAIQELAARVQTLETR